MARLNLDQLKAFLAVVRLGSISRAAQALNLTQPAITTRIRNLEANLHADLFERRPAGITLTKRGDLLVRYAEQIEQLSEMISAEVMDPEGIEGHLRLGVSETIAQCWLPGLVTSLHKTFPGIEVEINVDISLNLRQDLLNREIDLAILLGPISEFTVNNVDLPGFELAWYCPVSEHGTHGPEQDLFRLPVITYARNTRPFRELKATLLERIGPDVSLFPSSSLSACFRLVEAGLGVAALPRRMGQGIVDAGQITEFDPGWVPSPLKFTASYIAEPRSHLVETAARLALEVAEEFHAS
ncbi:LysR family transcriptional regulator [uncultured Nitratireductor sp.]|uniref:LysR family transcriptional regulator n=1 Tax=uncultured Nitratireductor sp. TaxID=520953 RepID=UPI0025DD2B26|nr:LysR family transcriptional regulator [uncultured Nitratireductor sp.]